MTPAEHITLAEEALGDAKASADGGFPFEVLAEILTALTHAVIAIAVETGVPHASTTTAG